MSIRIIDHKKLDMTEEEFTMYNSICRSYDRPNAKGEDLFKDLFETDNDGIILYLKPPSKGYTSMEVFLFITSVFLQQHLRLMHGQINQACAYMKAKADGKK
jgi:hypothetical protein